MMATPAQPGQPPSGNGGKHPEFKLRMPEAVSGGVYANSMVVQHTAQEFVLDFALLTAGQGQVVSRVITSPGHMKQIARAIDENLQKYEQMFGPIPAPPGKSG
jgi:hypothetical protein